ncbi:DUF1330 domain-containing protein [Reinekea sp.]|jgi:uncharacterized protein (DUF1330 family)|uniref:DUF1330 domain-containing protein n=1 Tax=Reinekea sp. TaxID=1970455 RepID=UPI002A836F61|nr:DUF1330 domain-containing protein [Reinekea sp.]
MAQPVFLIIEATPNPSEMEALKAYQSQTPPLAKKYGAIPVANYDVQAVLFGGTQPGVFSVLSFPSRAAIDGLFSDPAYQELIPTRDLGFTDLKFYVVNERL